MSRHDDELDVRLVFVIILFAVALRIGAIWILGTWRGGAHASGAHEHDVIARSLVGGTGFAFPFYADALEPTATQAPVMPALLATSYRILGVGQPGALLAMQCFQALWAVPAMWGIDRITSGLADARPRRYPVSLATWQGLALLGFAAAPALVYMVTRVQSINASVCGLLFVLGVFVRFLERPSGPMAIVGGIAVALSCLAEPILAMPLGLAWWGLFALLHRSEVEPAENPALRNGRTGSPGRLWAWAIPGVAALCVLPWVVRNTVALGEPTFIKSSFWYVFWQGNHIGASGTDKRNVDEALASRLRWQTGGASFEPVLEAARRQAVSVDAGLAKADLNSIRSLPTEVERMAWFGKRIRSELAAEPAHYPRMMARRLEMLVWFDPTNPRSLVLPYRFPYLVLSPLALIGLLLLGRPKGAASMFWLAGIGLVIPLSAIITSARFRLMIEAWMLVPAAYAVAVGIFRLGFQLKPGSKRYGETLEARNS